MGNRVKRKNIAFGLLLALGLAGASYEGYQYRKLERLNQALLAGNVVTDNDFPYQQKFAAAYYQGTQQDYKHAIQSYSQLLETAVTPQQLAAIQYNIGNNLFLSGLLRRVNDDGSLKDEARYAFSQARIAYMQALRQDPSARAAKFNLSLLLSVMPQHMKLRDKEQSGMQLSNLPIGLP